MTVSEIKHVPTEQGAQAATPMNHKSLFGDDLDKTTPAMQYHSNQGFDGELMDD